MQFQPSIVFIVDQESFNHEENTFLVEFLTRKGLQIEQVIWNDAKVWGEDGNGWKQYNTIIIKSPWDYQEIEKRDSFFAWLDKLEQRGLYVLNPIDILRWNADKIYLKELETKGVNTVPTKWWDKNTTFNLVELFEEWNVEKIVTKPRISGNARSTETWTREQLLENVDYIQKLAEKENFMIQPFIKEIQTEGEWSLLFFGGKYSHTILKKPQSNDFKVQGGKKEIREPPELLLESAKEIVKNFAQNCLYVCVDGLQVEGKLILVELELIEPSLFLWAKDSSIEKYFEALNSFLQKRS